MRVTRPIVPDFQKCQEVYGWNKVVAFEIADRLNDVHEVRPDLQLKGISNIVKVF